MLLLWGPRTASCKVTSSNGSGGEPSLYSMRKVDGSQKAATNCFPSWLPERTVPMWKGWCSTNGFRWKNWAEFILTQMGLSQTSPSVLCWPLCWPLWSSLLILWFYCSYAVFLETFHIGRLTGRFYYSRGWMCGQEPNLPPPTPGSIGLVG